MSSENKVIGARLRAARKAAGLTVADLAEQWRDLAPERVRRRLPTLKDLERTIRGHEAGGHKPGPRYRLLWARALQVPEDELFAEGGGEVSRRDALLLTAAAGATLPRRPTGYVAPELPDYFAEQLAGHYRADRYLGPLRLIPTATTQYNLLCDLAGEAQAPLRPRLWSLAAGYAAFLGWLHQDGGDLDESARWHDVMLERAHRSHDPQLVAFALHNKAMLLADFGDGPGVLDLTGAALVHSNRLTPKVRVLALQQSAHGVSLTAAAMDPTDGRGRDEVASKCTRLLDEAAALVGQTDDEYPWGTACHTPHYLAIQRATCLTRIGRADKALTIWERIMPVLVEGGARRDVGVFRARQAQAYASGCEPEEAVTVAGEVIHAAEETGSARMRRELRVLRDRMRPWARERPGRQLAEMLAGMGGHT